MKILYSAGNRSSAAQQLYDFASNCKDHEIKVAAYIKSGALLKNVDWTLDAIYRSPNSKSLPPYILLLKDIEYYDPDLIITDVEPIVSNMAKQYGIPLWYCSPLYLLKGLESNIKERYYLFEAMRAFLDNLPEPDRILIYSPFGDLLNAPRLLPGYEWVAPYHNMFNCNSGTKKIAMIDDVTRKTDLGQILKSVPGIDINVCRNYYRYKTTIPSSDWFFTEGGTKYIADGIYGGVKRLCVAPNANDMAAVINALICRRHGLGDNVGQVEFMKRYAIDEIERSINATADNFNLALNHERLKFLHEKIGEIRTEV